MAKINRLYASDYHEQMQNLEDEIAKLQMVVSTRLYSLCIAYPQAPINIMRNEGEEVVIKANSLIPETRGKTTISALSFEDRIKYIGSIENWLYDQHQYNQTSMQFEDPICNCDKRDMPVYQEDGKKLCPQCGYEVK